jgi:hypothetical protein
VLQPTSNANALALNVNYDGSNWVLDDVALAAIIAQMTVSAGASAFAIYGFTAGANPRTPTQLMVLDTNQLSSVVNFLLNKANGEIIIGNPTSASRARFLQHVPNAAVLTLNAYYGGGWNIDDPAQPGYLIHMSGGSLGFYSLPAGSPNPRTPQLLMSLDTTGMTVNVPVVRTVEGMILTDAATVAIDSAKGPYFRLVTGGSRTLAAPSNAVDGRRIVIQHYASGGAWTLALTGGAGGFAFSSDIPGLTATATNKSDYITAIYSGLYGLWHVVAVTKGF